MATAEYEHFRPHVVVGSISGAHKASPTPECEMPPRTEAERPPVENRSIEYTQQPLDLLPFLDLIFAALPPPHPVRNSGTFHRLNKPPYSCRRKEYSAFTISDGRVVADPGKFGKRWLLIHLSNAFRLCLLCSFP